MASKGKRNSAKRGAARTGSPVSAQNNRAWRAAVGKGNYSAKQRGRPGSMQASVNGSTSGS